MQAPRAQARATISQGFDSTASDRTIAISGDNETSKTEEPSRTG
jgi:hypothetical protein